MLIVVDTGNHCCWLIAHSVAVLVSSLDHMRAELISCLRGMKRCFEGPKWVSSLRGVSKRLMIKRVNYRFHCISHFILLFRIARKRRVTSGSPRISMDLPAQFGFPVFKNLLGFTCRAATWPWNSSRSLSPISPRLPWERYDCSVASLVDMFQPFSTC